MPSLSSLSSSLLSSLPERKADVLLYELNGKTDIETGRTLAFQYFPETLTDSKQVNYQRKEIPGGSLPLYQWTNSGERTISFTAIFSSDVDLTLNPSLRENLDGTGKGRRNIDIRAAILWLRRFMLPRYSSVDQSFDDADAASNMSIGTPLTYAPRKCMLYIPNSGIGLYGGNTGWHTSDSMFALMTQCEVVLDAFFPSGLPKLATVQLQFAQVAQLGGRIKFPSLTTTLEDIGKGLDPTIFRYDVKASKKGGAGDGGGELE